MADDYDDDMIVYSFDSEDEEKTVAAGVKRYFDENGQSQFADMKSQIGDTLSKYKEGAGQAGLEATASAMTSAATSSLDKDTIAKQYQEVSSSTRRAMDKQSAMIQKSVEIQKHIDDTVSKVSDSQISIAQNAQSSAKSASDMLQSRINSDRSQSRDKTASFDQKSTVDISAFKDTLNKLGLSKISQNASAFESASNNLLSRIKTISEISKAMQYGIPSGLSLSAAANGTKLSDIRAKISESAEKAVQNIGDQPVQFASQQNAVTGNIAGVSAGQQADQASRQANDIVNNAANVAQSARAIANRVPIKTSTVPEAEATTGRIVSSTTAAGDSLASTGADIANTAKIAGTAANVGKLATGATEAASATSTAGAAGAAGATEAASAAGAAGAAGAGGGILSGIASGAAGLVTKLAPPLAIASAVGAVLKTGADSYRNALTQGNLQGEGAGEGYRMMTQNGMQDAAKFFGLSNVSGSDIQQYRSWASQSGFKVNSQAGQNAIDIQRWSKENGLDSGTTAQFTETMLKLGDSSDDAKEAINGLKDAAKDAGTDLKQFSANAANVNTMLRQQGAGEGSEAKATDLTKQLTTGLEDAGLSNKQSAVSSLMNSSLYLQNIRKLTPGSDQIQVMNDQGAIAYAAKKGIGDEALQNTLKTVYQQANGIGGSEDNRKAMFAQLMQGYGLSGLLEDTDTTWKKLSTNNPTVSYDSSGQSENGALHWKVSVEPGSDFASNSKKSQSIYNGYYGDTSSYTKANN